MESSGTVSINPRRAFEFDELCSKFGSTNVSTRNCDARREWCNNPFY